MDWKNKYLVFILCFISSVCILKAQETGYYIEGQVTDSKTGEAIYGAAVNIKDSGIWTMTDDKGIFSFSNLHGSGTITVSCLGYVDISVPFTQESAFSIKKSAWTSTLWPWMK